jgi:hypothetical protein
MTPAIQPSQQAVQLPQSRVAARADAGAAGVIDITMPQHFLYFFPLPQEQESFLPGFISGFFRLFALRRFVLSGGTVVCRGGRCYNNSGLHPLSSMRRRLHSCC